MTLKTHRKAFTLVELIISMTILATIAAIAVISADDMGETSRYDETDRRGKVIQNSLVGYDTPRFLQDMGRMPVVLVTLDDLDTTDTSSTDADYAELIERKKLFLAELIDLEADSTLLYDYENAQRVKKQERSIDIDLANITAASDTVTEPAVTNFPFDSVTIKAGWAGPYALSGSENMTDNWGKPWDIYHYGIDETTSTTDEILKWATPVGDETFVDTNDEISEEQDDYTEIYGIRSIYSEDYVSDLSYKFPENSVYADDVTIKLLTATGETIETDDYANIRVFLYLPYCEPRANGKKTDDAPYPRVIELCLWANYYSGTTTSGMRIRYDVSGVESPTSYSASYVGDTDFTYPTYLKARFDESATSFNNFALNSVPVGSRKIWAYATNGSSTGIFAPLQNVKITATNNTIELRLTETFSE